MTTDTAQATRKEVRSRADLVRQLLARLDRLAPRLGDVSLAAELQLFKRELARGHAILSVRPEDNNFLSVITLVEASLASLTWKDYKPEILDTLRTAISAGAADAPFTFDQYEAIRQEFKKSGIPTGPTLPLTAQPEAEDGQET